MLHVRQPGTLDAGMPSCAEHKRGAKPLKPCGSARVTGSDRCWQHGDHAGNLRRRLDNDIIPAVGGGYDGAIYSLRTIPQHIAERLRRARDAADPMSLSEELALARARLSLLLDMAESGQAGASLAVPSLEKTIDTIAKLVDTESRVRQRTAQQLTQANVDAAIGVVLDKVLEHCGPEVLRKTIDAIAHDLGIGAERRRGIMPEGMRPGDAAAAAAGARLTSVVPVASSNTEDATHDEETEQSHDDE